MKNFLYAILFLLPSLALAGLPPTTTKGSADSVPVTTFQLNTPNIPVTHSGTVATLGAIPNAALANSSVTVNGTTCTLGASCTPAASSALAISTKTTTYTLTNSDDVIICNGTFTITLQSAASATIKPYYIKNIGTGTCTISSADLIDGLSTLVISTQWAGVMIIPNGTTWYGF